MSDLRKSILASLGVVSSVAAVVVGFTVRQRADLGVMEASNKDAPISRLLASRTNEANVPAADYFFELSRKLKQEYVEPVTDDQKLASGAIRGMIASLDDPASQYLDKDQFRLFMNERQGKFEGIGADFALKLRSHYHAPDAIQQADESMTAEDAMVLVKEIPRLEVTSVVPGGPADKAGVKIGDTVYSIDDHWVVNSDLLNQLRIVAKKVNDKTMPKSSLKALQTELRKKAERALFPLRAKDRLQTGRSGVVTIVWERNGTQRTTKITKAASSLAGFSVAGGKINLPFVEGSATELKAAIKEKNAVTIDLRNNTEGDIQAMKQCLAVVAPKDTYGYFVTKRHDSPVPLSIFEGNSRPPRMTLLTDKSTRGAAEIFATALASKGLATVDKAPMGGDMTSVQIVTLQDGTGYTLATSVYQPTLNKAKQVLAKGRVTK